MPIHANHHKERGWRLFQDCRDRNLNLWQCPSFLFFIMGVVNIVAILATYFTASFYTDEPQMVALIVLIVALVVFIIGDLIVDNFNQLAEANRLKSEFISVASHELRSPLSSMRWLADMLYSGRVGEMTEKQRDLVESIREANAHMADLVNDLLDVSRVEKGEIKRDIKEFSITEVAREVADSLRPMAESRNIRIEVNSDESDYKIKADPNHIKIALQNIIDNAIKYTRGGGLVDLRISAVGRFVKVAVSDGGVGISAADQAHIFEKFFRADNALRYETRGTGLGLFIAKSFVEDCGGEIGFQSQEGKGSVFWFTAPKSTKL